MCDNRMFRIIDKQGFKSDVEPYPKAACNVLVYVSPWRSCKTWQRAGYTSLMFNIFLPILKLPESIQNASDFNGIPAETQFIRSRQYFLFVGHKQSSNMLYSHSIFYAYDMFLQQRNLLMYSNRAAFAFKLFYEIDVLPTRILLQAYLVQLADSKETYTLTTSVCPNTPPFADICIQATLGSRKYLYFKISERILKGILNFERHIASIQMKTHSVWNLQCRTKCTFSKWSSVLFNIRKTRLDINVQDFPLEKLFLKYLFPNSTIIVNETVLATYNSYGASMFTNGGTNELQFVRLETRGYAFVTCTNIVDVSQLSLLGLTKCFDLYTWACSLCSVFMLSLLCNLLCEPNKFRFGNTLVYSGAFLGALIEQSLERLQGKRSRVFAWSWILVSVVISNAYRGDNIMDIISPIRREKLSTFAQLFKHNFTFLSSFYKGDGLESKFRIMIEQWVGWEYGNSLENASVTNHSDTIGVLGNQIKLRGIHRNYGKNSSVAVKNICKRLWHPEIRADITAEITDPQFYENKLKECKRLAYVEDYNVVYDMYFKLLKVKNPNLITISREYLDSLALTWLFRGAPVSTTALEIRLASLMQSGIVQTVQGWHWNQAENGILQQRRPEVKKVTTEDNVVVLFYLYLLCVLLAATSFLREKFTDLLYHIKLYWAKCFNTTKPIRI